MAMTAWWGAAGNDLLLGQITWPRYNLWEGLGGRHATGWCGCGSSVWRRRRRRRFTVMMVTMSSSVEPGADFLDGGGPGAGTELS